MWRPDPHLHLQVHQGVLTSSPKIRSQRTETERITSCTGCIPSYFRLWPGNLLTYKDFCLTLTYQHYWNSPTVWELESKSQIRPLDARWHFANLITWGKKTPNKPPLDSRTVRKNSSSQQECQLVRQTDSCTPCLEALNIINVCCVCRQQEGDDLLPSGAERKGMARKASKEFIILSVLLAVPSQEISVALLLTL